MRVGFLSAFAWTLLGKLGQQASGLLVGALITRALGPSGRGVFAEIQTWLGVSLALFGCSLDTAIYHFANRERYPVQDGARLALTLAVSLGAGVLASTAMVMFTWVRPEELSVEGAAHLPWTVAAVIATALALNLGTLAQALGRVQLVAAASLGQGVVNAAIIVGAFVADAIDIRLALGSVIATQLAGAAISVGGFLRTERLTTRGLTAPMVRAFLGAGMKQHVATVSAFVYSRLNLLIVFRYCGAEEAGFLATAWVLAFGIQGLLGSFQLALYSRVIHHADDFDITLRSIRIALYFGLLLTVPVMALARPILAAYGGEAFGPAAATFRFLLLAAWVMFLSSLGAPYCIKAGAFVISSASALLVGAVSVAANLILVPRLGAEGGAIATLLSVVVGFSLSLGLLRMISGKSPLRALVPDFREEVNAARRLLSSIVAARMVRR